VYVDTPAWFVRPKNTDWLYMRRLKALERYVNVKTFYACDLRDILHESGTYVVRKFRRGPSRTGGQYFRDGSVTERLAHDSDVILCHRRFPLTAGRIPVIWQCCVLDPQMQMASGRSDTQIELDYAEQAQAYQLAGAVQVSTEAEVARHAMRFPNLSAKFRNVPFFLDHVEAIDKNDLRAKHDGSWPLKILFVGRDARRKGLDLLIQAYLGLPAALRSRCELDVVSSTLDGIRIPSNLGIRWHGSLPSREVQRLMRAAHVFAMPSRFESFGFTFVEAMAAGCTVIGPQWEVQSEILNYGCAGYVVHPSSDAVSAAFRRVCEDPDLRLRLATSAHERFLEKYAPAAVASSYYKMFESVS